MADAMTGRERLMAAMRGEPVDRVPIWLREGFPITEPLADADSFGSGWQADPAYRALYDEIIPFADDFHNWGAGDLGGDWGRWSNRFLMVPPQYIHSEETQVTRDLRRIVETVDAPCGPLTSVDEFRRGHNTAWHVKTLVESVEDLKKLAEVPYDFDTSCVEGIVAGYQRARAQVADRGALRISLSSPIVSISGCMKLETFLEFSLTEKALFHELLQEITRRNLILVDAVFGECEMDTTVNVGGSEQCTPPMMPPEAYAEYVSPYDGQLVDRLHEYGVLVNCHCHGKVSRGLRSMAEMGFDATDPVEPPPAGDVTYAQAREIVDGRVTLVGNLEFGELCFAEPQHIRERVREILGFGKERLILGASAGPISAVAPRLAENYRAWVETALTYG